MRRCRQLRACRAARLLVFAVQAAQDTRRCREARNGTEAFISCGHDSMLPCHPKLVSDPFQPNMTGIDRFALVKAQVKLIPADRDLKRISCLDCKGFALGTDRYALSDVSSVCG